MRDPTPYDHMLAKANPWKLTPHQCFVMRLHCKLGHAKLIWRMTDMPIKTVHSHIEHVRVRMGLPGRDIRIFTWWDAWARQYINNRNEKTHLQKAAKETRLQLGPTVGEDSHSDQRVGADDTCGVV
jgi:hypothetical protein